MTYKIGIICITTEGSTVCEKRISFLGGAKGNYPAYSVEAIPFKETFPVLFSRNWQQLANLIVESINNLPKNVDFVIIPSNTPHYAYDLIHAQSPKPVLDLIEITAEACKQANYKKVAILGTKLTMREGLYEKKIAARDIELIVPPENICDIIDALIREVLVPGKPISKGSEREKQFQETLALIKGAINCDAFILGCTELTPFGEYLTSIDTTLLLAQVAYNIAMNEDSASLSYYAHKQENIKNH